MKIKVSGKSHRTACTPDVSSVPTDQDWPEPVSRPVGTGTQWIYEGDSVLAKQISDHLRDLGHKYMENKDQENRAIGRTLLRDAVLIQGSIPRKSLVL